MKKVFCFVVCCIALLAVTSCGNNSNSNNHEGTTQDISVTGADGTVYHSYQTACSNGDYDAARDYIGKMKLQLASMDNVGYTAQEQRMAYAEFVNEAEFYVVNEEIQYLASLNEEQANNRIILILNQQSIEGFEAVEKTCLDKHIFLSMLDGHKASKQTNDFIKYIARCGKYNSQCSSILSIAIACGNESLAKKILHSFRPDPEIQSEKCKGNNDWYDIYAHYTNASKEAAQKKYNEAVKSGAFNK